MVNNGGCCYPITEGLAVIFPLSLNCFVKWCGKWRESEREGERETLFFASVFSGARLCGKALKKYPG